jgi:hypothetical protein
MSPKAEIGVTLATGPLSGLYPPEEYKTGQDDLGRAVLRLSAVRRPTSWYSPLDHPELVNELRDLKEGDEKAVRRFVVRYGFLGYQTLMEREIRKPADSKYDPLLSEPFNWIWHHARTVRLLLDAVQVLQQKDAKQRETSAHRFAKDLLKLDPENSELVTLSETSQSVSVRVALRAMLGWRAIALGNVSAGLADFSLSILKENMRGVGRVPQFGPRGFSSDFHFPALVSSIYWQIQDGLDGGGLRRCQACKKLFFSTHANQLYCPAAPGKKSKCGSRYRKQSERKRLRRKAR